METVSAAEFLPSRLSLKALREAAAGCRGCPPWSTATQTVFGEGPKAAEVMLVGEQPGDQDDPNAAVRRGLKVVAEQLQNANGAA